MYWIDDIIVEGAVLTQQSARLPEDARSNNDRTHHNSNKDDFHHVAIKSGSTSTRLSNLKSRVQALGASSQTRDIRTSPNQQSVLSSYNLPRAPSPHKLPKSYLTKTGNDLEENAPSPCESDEIVLAIPSRPRFDDHHPPSPSIALPTLDEISSRSSPRTEEAQWSDGGSELSYVSMPENYEPIPRPIVRSPIIIIDDDESGSEEAGPSFGIWEDKVASTKVGALKIDMTSFSNQAKLLSLFLEADGAVKSSRKVRRIDREEEEVESGNGLIEMDSEGDEVISGEMEEEIMSEEEEEDLPTLASLVSHPLSKTNLKKSVQSRAIPLVATSSSTTLKNPPLATKRSHRRQSPPSLPDRYVHQDSADDEKPVVALPRIKKSVPSTTAQTSKVAPTTTSKPSKAGLKKARKEEPMEIIEFDTQDLVEELPKRRRIVPRVEEESESSEVESELESFGTDEDE